MKAAVVPAPGEPLEIRDVPIPTPGPGQVLVRIESSGLCHTDIHAARGEWPVKPKDQLIPGHEGVGHVVGLGDGVDLLAVGDRVALPWLGHACGHCRYCVAGWETYCTTPEYMGYTIDGSYAEYAIGFASHVVQVPDGITAVDAAPLTCAGVTTYKAIKVGRPQPGENVAVVGIGGLGHLGRSTRRSSARRPSRSTSRTTSSSWPRISAPTTSWTHAATRRRSSRRWVALISPWSRCLRPA